MQPKTIKILYWTLTTLFAAAMFADGIGGITRAEAGQEVMKHLGYPMYILSIFGVAKILGALAIVQPYFRTIKEWAYAGFTINFVGAAASWAFAGDGVAFMLPPFVALVFMLITYFLWKKVEQLRTTDYYTGIATPNF